MDELRQWIPLLLHYPAGMVIGYLLATKLGAFLGPLIRNSLERWVSAHVGLVDSLTLAVKGIVASLGNIEEAQFRHRAENQANFDQLKERLK